MLLRDLVKMLFNEQPKEELWPHEVPFTCKTGKTKSHPPSGDLRYGEKDSISPRTLIFAAI